jgi:carbamoyl-phosphate synthase large subunit
VKTPVLPFVKFPGFDPRLTPEMHSTGEVMGIAHDLGRAYYKAQLGAGTRLPKSGTAFITVNERDHENVIDVAKRLVAVGFELIATGGRGHARWFAGGPRRRSASSSREAISVLGSWRVLEPERAPACHGH